MSPVSSKPAPRVPLPMHAAGRRTDGNPDVSCPPFSPLERLSASPPRPGWRFEDVATSWSMSEQGALRAAGGNR